MRKAKGQNVPVRTVHSGTNLREIAKEAGKSCRNKYGVIPFWRKQHARKSDNLVSDIDSEISETKSETKRNMTKYETEKSRLKCGSQNFLETFCKENASRLLEKYKLKCDCEKCLMMCETPIEARVATNFRLN